MINKDFQLISHWINKPIKDQNDKAFWFPSTEKGEKKGTHIHKIK